MGKITLILGGARSGKSSYALTEASLLEGKKAFIATAEGLDDEMKERIVRHKAERDQSWETFEEPLNIKDVLKEVEARHPVVVIDCLTLWVSNLLYRELNPKEEFDALVAALLKCRNSEIFIVSNEVGMGLVPDYPLGRAYRDCLGTLNRMIAHISTQVVLLVAGIPLTIKDDK